MYLIYKHTSPSGNAYIGLTSRGMEIRLQEHKKGAEGNSTTSFSKAIRKYGLESFKSEILEDKIVTIEEAREKEEYYILKYNTYKDGYNMTPGGDGVPRGFKNSKEFCKKRSELTTGENNPMYGYVWDEKQLKNHSERMKETFKNGRKHHMLGKKHSFESKIKNSLSNKQAYENGKRHPLLGVKMPEERKDKIRNSLLGTKSPRVCCLGCRKDIASSVINRHQRGNNCK